jgi:teichuronic acid exporter
LAESLKNTAERAATWSAIDGLVRSVFGFLFVVLLARLVDPSQFGLMAIVLAFNAVGTVLVDAGMASALIQRKDVSSHHEAAAFYFSVTISLILAATLTFAAPHIASFFAQPILVELSPMVAINLVVCALGTVPIACHVRALNLRPLVWIGFCASLLSGIVAVVMARHGYGVWSLAWQMVLQSSVMTILLWWRYPWRPRTNFDLPSLSQLMSFASPIMIANIIDVVYIRMHSLVIGKLFSTFDLGVYTRAQSTQQVPASFVAGVLNRVAFPAFSRVSDNQDQLRFVFASALRLVMFLNLPLMVAMSVTADLLIELLFGEPWISASPLLSILCIIGIFWPIQLLNVGALLAQGRSALLLRIEIPKKLIGALALASSFPYGLEAIAWGQVLASVFAFMLNAFYSGKLFGFGALQQLKLLARIFFAAMIMMVSMLVVDELFTPATDLKLLILLSTGLLAYLGASFLLGIPELTAMWRYLRQLLRSR